MQKIGEHVLLFDGVCILCNSLVQFIIKRDPEAKLKFASLQSDYGQLRLKEFNLPLHDFDSLVFISGNKFYTKSTAVLEALKQLGCIYKLLYVFRIIPKPLRDIMYTFVAKIRYKLFGKTDACLVPTVETKRHFIA